MTLTRARRNWGLCPQTPGIYRFFSARMGMFGVIQGTGQTCPPPFRLLNRSLGIAVGMTITDHPPHRSVLAELPHTAPPLDTSVEALIGIGMKSTRARNPSIKDRPQLFPIRLPPLTTTT